MTYIDYLNTFHQWCESNTLPVNSRLLYMELLHVFNRAGWPENVRVDNLRLALMAGVSTEKSAIRARDALVSAGFIIYQKGKKGTPGKYGLCEITCNHYSVYDSLSDSENDSLSDSENDRENDSHIKTKNKTKTKTDLSIPNGMDCRADMQRAVDAWNKIGLQKVTKLVPDTDRYKMLRSRIKTFGIDAVLQAFENVRTSDFLMGRAGKRQFQATFDWVIRPNNFQKVLEGNYSDRRETPSESAQNRGSFYEILGIEGMKGGEP